MRNISSRGQGGCTSPVCSIFGPQCVQERTARRARSSAAEADMDEFRAGIHNDRGFGNDFRNERG